MAAAFAIGIALASAHPLSSPTAGYIAALIAALVASRLRRVPKVDAVDAVAAVDDHIDADDRAAAHVGGDVDAGASVGVDVDDDRRFDVWRLLAKARQALRKRVQRIGRWRIVGQALLWCACLIAGMARGTRAPIAASGADDRVVDHVTGRASGLPIQTASGGFGVRLTDARNGDFAIDDVWVWSGEQVLPGERVAVSGRLQTPRGSIGPGQPDRAAATEARGARLEITATAVERRGENIGVEDRVWRWAIAKQAAWANRIDEAGGDAAAKAALRGIVVGDRAPIPETLDARWRTVGIFHVLSVSGLHLAVIAGIAFSLLRRFVAAALFRGCVRPARWAAPPALAIAIAYTLVTGAQLATVRALVVITLVLVAAMLDRPLRLLDAIGVAALAVLAWRPADLFDPSFQLSFTAAMVLAVAATRETHGIRAWIVRGMMTSAWVALATAPITAYHFQQVQPGGIAGNLVLTPLLELLALPIALVGVVLDWSVPIRVATWLVGGVDGAAGFVAHVMPVGHIAIGDGITLAVLVILSIGLAALRRRRAIGWAALCVVWSVAGQPAQQGDLRVTFVDVGQGDAAILELPDGAVWLVDAGGNANARDLAHASATGAILARTLAVYGKHRIDLAIVSHPHPDHYLGLASIGVPIGELWSAREETTEGSFAKLVERLGVPLVHPPLGVARSQAGVNLIVWAPRYEDIEAADPVRTVNDNSLVIEVRYHGRSILFSGDLEAEGEEALVAAGIAPVDIVKVPHHGSPTSSTQPFVDATRPQLAVISCGRANQFNFPSPDVVARWRAAGADVARTDQQGSITVLIDATGGFHYSR